MGWFGREERMSGEIRSGHVQDDVRAARQARLELTATQRQLVEAISAILFRADPIGIDFDTNADEYDAEAESIVISLPRTAGVDDVKVLTHDVFVQWFDEATAGPVERYAEVATEIWDIWRRHADRAGLTAD